MVAIKEANTSVRCAMLPMGENHTQQNKSKMRDSWNRIVLIDIALSGFYKSNTLRVNQHLLEAELTLKVLYY